MSAQLAQAVKLAISELDWLPTSEATRAIRARQQRLLEELRKALAAHEAAPQQEPDLCQYCGDLAYPGCKSEFEGEPACRFWAAPQQEPVASIDELAANVRVCFGEGAAAFNEGVDALAAEYKRCAAPQQAQAPGWQLVPVEPTPEMESECMGLLMCESLVYERPHGGLSVETIAPVKLWAAMLKAAPQQGSKT